jgi:hypothetical protein
MRRRRVGCETPASDIERAGADGVSSGVMGLLGAVGGFALGLALWSRQMRQFRRGLFSPNPVHRYAALGYLGARPSAETARLLQDYVRWETRPLLRKRASLALRRMEQSLDS